MSSEKLFITMERSSSNEDWFLQTMVVTVTLNNSEMPLTITTNGTLITGNLISVRRYFSLYADSLPNSASGLEDVQNYEIIRKTYSEIGAEFSDKIINWYQENPANGLRMTKYLHLANAKFVHGAIVTPPRGFLWRGKISEIDGFSFGILRDDTSFRPKF